MKFMFYFNKKVFCFFFPSNVHKVSKETADLRISSSNCSLRVPGRRYSVTTGL